MRPDGYRTEISYEDGRVKRIQELAPNPNGSGDEEGKWRSWLLITLSKQPGNICNTSYVYDFDSYGRTISINRQDGTLVTADILQKWTQETERWQVQMQQKQQGDRLLGIGKICGEPAV